MRNLTGEFGSEKAVHLALQEPLWHVHTQWQNLWHNMASYLALPHKGQNTKVAMNDDTTNYVAEVASNLI